MDSEPIVVHATPKYTVGEIVVTKRPVKVRTYVGNVDGYAMPGWRWWVHEVEVDGNRVYYHLADNRNFYHCRIREGRIMGKVT